MKKTANSSNFHGVGRRKSSVARVWLKKGKGDLSINGRDIKDYFCTKITNNMVSAPGKVTGMSKNIDIKVNVCGGGRNGQAGAVRLGISRALIAFDEKLRSILKKNGFLTVDSRLKERKKYGQKGARRKFQFVKR